MRFLILGALLIASPAFAAGPDQGTFAGQTTRGEHVQFNHDLYGTGKDGPWSSEVVKQAQAGIRDDEIQKQIGDESLGPTVGNGRNK